MPRSPSHDAVPAGALDTGAQRLDRTRADLA